MTQAPETIPAVPDELVEVAEEIVDEADYAYHDFQIAMRQAAGTWEKQMQISHAYSKAVGRWAVRFTEKSASNLLRFAHKTVIAKDAVEFVRLQIEFVETSGKLWAEEIEKLGQILIRTTVKGAEF